MIPRRVSFDEAVEYAQAKAAEDRTDLVALGDRVGLSTAHRVTPPDRAPEHELEYVRSDDGAVRLVVTGWAPIRPPRWSSRHDGYDESGRPRRSAYTLLQSPRDGPPEKRGVGWTGDPLRGTGNPRKGREPMTAERGMDPIDFHSFEPGLQVVAKPDALGRVRTRVRCRRCGAYQNAPSHRSRERLNAQSETFRRNLESQRPAIVPDPPPPDAYGPDGHEFVPGAAFETIDAREVIRTRTKCAVCGLYSNAARHRTLESREAAERKRQATVQARRPDRPPAPPAARKPKSERPGYVAPVYHAFEPSGETITRRGGNNTRQIPLCTCGAPKNAPRHRSAERIAADAAKVRDRNARARTVDEANEHAIAEQVRIGFPSDRLAELVEEPAEPTVEAGPGGEETDVEAAPVQGVDEAVAPMFADPGALAFHEYKFGGNVTVDARGRHRPLCECGAPKNAPRHTSPERMAARLAAMAASKAAKARARDEAVAEVVEEPVVEADPDRADRGGPLPTPIRTPTRVQRERISVPAAELASLALAIDAVLALPVDRLPWKLRLRLGEVRPLIDIPTFPSLASTAFEEPVPDAPSDVMVEALPQLRPVDRGPVALQSAQSLLRGIRNDRMRKLARRAIAAGWDPAMTGSGHLALTRGSRRLVISTTSSGGARGWANLRADAKRLGIDVTGL